MTGVFLFHGKWREQYGRSSALEFFCAYFTRLNFVMVTFFKKWNKSPYEFRKYQDSDLEKTMCYYKSPPEVCDFRWAFGIDIFI